MVEKEEFRDIEGYEGIYQVSNLGRVKSLPRVIERSNGRSISVKGRILKPLVYSNKYHGVVLTLSGKKTMLSIHSLVAKAFLNHKPHAKWRVINHKNGVRDDNRLSNLEIVTARENLSTCYRKNEKKYSSKYVGVSINSKTGKWASAIIINGKKKYLGLFKCEKKASNAYQKALKEHLQNNQTKK